MRKILLVICCLFFFVVMVEAKENEPLRMVSIVNKCSVVEDNSVVIPVSVIAINNGSLTKLINEYSLGYVDNKDNINMIITGIDGVSDVIIDNNKNSESRSLINYYLVEDINANKLDKVMSFNIQIEFMEVVPNTLYVLGNDVLLTRDMKVCESVNGYEITKVEKIKYVDLSETNHIEMINALIIKIVIIILIIVVIVFGVLLVKKKK